MKPCPFCGSENVTVFEYFVKCMACTATGPSVYYPGGPEELWNRRTVTDEEILDWALKALRKE